MADTKELTLFHGLQGTAAIANFSLNQTTDQLEFIFQAPEDATITRLGLRQGIVTGTSPVYIVSLQGVDISGNPDGTILGGASPASVTFTPVAGGNSTWQWKTLTNSIAIQRGTAYAMVIAYSSGTVDASNFCSFGATSTTTPPPGLPLSINNDNGVRARTQSTPLFGYGSASKAYGRPLQSVITATYTVGTVKALKLSVPSTWWSTFKVAGVQINGVWSAGGGTFDLRLYASSDTDGTNILQLLNDFDADHDRAATGANFRHYYFPEDTLSTLNAGSAYRIGFEPSQNFAVYGITCDVADDLEAWPMGSYATLSTLAAGVWTDDTKSRVMIHPILADITAPAGAGGIMTHPGMSGGFRG